MMKTFSPAFLVFALVFSPFCLAQPQGENQTISITMDDVPLEDLVRIMSRFSEATLYFNPEDPIFRERVTLTANDQPWTSVLRGALVPKGLLLLENEPHAGAFSIVSPENESLAARIRTAQEANVVVEAALEALAADNPERAKALLTEYKRTNDALIQSATPPKP